MNELGKIGAIRCFVEYFAPACPVEERLLKSATLEYESLTATIAELRKHLKWIADQPCCGSWEDRDCKDTEDCITEWCLPCYARQAIAPAEADTLFPEFP